MQPGFRDQHLQEEECILGWALWFTTFPLETFVSVSQVADVGLQLPGSSGEIESGPLTQRARRDWRRRRTTPDWQLADWISKGTYIQGLSWVAAGWDLCQNLKSLYRGFNEVQLHIVQMVSTTLYSLKIASLKQLRLWEWWVEGAFQGHWGRWGALIARIQFTSQPTVKSFWWPPTAE